MSIQNEQLGFEQLPDPLAEAYLALRSDVRNLMDPVSDYNQREWTRTLTADGMRFVSHETAAGRVPSSDMTVRALEGGGSSVLLISRKPSQIDYRERVFVFDLPNDIAAASCIASAQEFELSFGKACHASEVDFFAAQLGIQEVQELRTFVETITTAAETRPSILRRAARWLIQH